MHKQELAHAWGVHTARAHSFDTRERELIAGTTSKNNKTNSSTSAQTNAGILLTCYADVVQYLLNNCGGTCLNNSWEYRMHNSCTPLVKSPAMLMRITSSMSRAQLLCGIICLSFLSFNASKFQTCKIYRHVHLRFCTSRMGGCHEVNTCKCNQGYRILQADILSTTSTIQIETTIFPLHRWQKPLYRRLDQFK